MRSFIHRPTFYVIHHSGFLDYFLDLDGHTLEDCDFERYTMRSETFAERAPLLSQGGLSPHDHSIFMRVCHSPWHFLGQRGLLLARVTLAVYLSAVLLLCIVYHDTSGFRGSMFAFDARNLSIILQVVYYWITAVGSTFVKERLAYASQLISIKDLGPATSHGTSKYPAS